MQDKITANIYDYSSSNHTAISSSTLAKIASNSTDEFVDDEYSIYGYNLQDLSVSQLKTWSMQRDFCLGLANGGTVLAGLQATAITNGKPISRRCYEYWFQSTDKEPNGKLGFRLKQADSWADYRDSLENRLQSICDNITEKNSVIPLLARLNKELPAYKQSQPSDTSSVDLINEVRRVFKLATNSDTKQIEYTEKIDKEKPD